jgi:2-polyprenyl-3-methyl-5-hydroxy-6-metoxy-1,4-benzoquinol methylase
METQNELLAMIMLHQAVSEQIKTTDIHDRYLSFYDKPIDKDLINKKLNKLTSENLLCISNNLIKLSDEGMIKGNNKYIEYYFSEGVMRAESSNIDKKYQESKNLGIINSDSIIDDEQLKFITNQLINYKNTIYDLGCGRGDIITYIQKKNNLSCIGIDKSENMIMISKAKNSNITWISDDIEQYCNKLSNYDAAILIDSIYFIKDKKKFINELFTKLNPDGKIIITFSTYTEDPQKINTLEPDRNILGEILNELNLNFDYQDFTTNEIALWEHRKNITESLREEYINEHNSFLYYDRMSESSNLLRVLKQDLGRRYIYIVKKK